MRFPYLASFIAAFACAFAGAATMPSAQGSDGSQLLHLDATHLDRGTIDDARLSDTIARLNAQNPTFSPPRLPDGTATTWTFKTPTDNAVATLRVSSEGSTVGATPNGYAQLEVNAQDEVPQPNGTRVGSNMSAYLRVAGATYNNGECNGTLCPQMSELLSSRDARITASGGGAISFVQRNAPRITIDRDGYAKAFTTVFGIDEYGQQAYQLGPLGMEVGGRETALYYPPRYPPADGMSSRRWVPGSVRVGAHLGVGCDVVPPFGRPVDAEAGEQASLCVQGGATGHETIGAQLNTPAKPMSADAAAVRVDTRVTKNDARNVGVAVTGGNPGPGGATAIHLTALGTPGVDYGLDVESHAGVEFPLAVRADQANLLLVCMDGGIVVGLGCDQSRGAGTINLSRGVFVDGRPIGGGGDAARREAAVRGR